VARDSDAGRDEVLAARQHERPRERCRDPLGGVDRVALRDDVLEQDPELVATEPRHGVAAAQCVLQTRCGRRQQLIADMMTEAVVDELEVVEVEEQDRGERLLPAEPRQRMLEPVDEQDAVGESRQWVVDGPFADRILDGLAIERIGEHVRQRLEKVDVARGKSSGPHRLDYEDAERPARPSLDLDRQSGPGSPPPELRLLKTGLGVPVLDHHRGAALQRVPRLRPHAGGIPELPELGVGPSDSAPQHQAALVGQVLPHRGNLGAQHVGGAGRGLLHQIGRAGALERVLAKQRHCCLLSRASLEFGLDLLAVADVMQHPVPAELTVLTAGEHGVVANPDGMPVAMEHPVFERFVLGLDAVVLVLARQDPVAVLGVQALGPQTRIGAPLRGGVAQDRLDLGAHVVPAPISAGVGDVDDRRNALEQLRVLRSGNASSLRTRRGLPGHHAGVAVADHVPC